MIKCIFWDNDGVLVDTEKLYFRASAEVLRTAGVELTEAVFADISLRRGESVLELAGQLGLDDMETLRQARNARYAELLGEEVEVIPGVVEVLRALHGRLRMAIVTSSRRDHFNIIHRSNGLIPFFEFALTREDYIHSKPHPEPYLTALARTGLHPSECLVIEDSERGLAAARAAGIRCFVLPGGLNRGGDFSAADRILGSIREIHAALFPSSIDPQPTCSDD